MILAGLTGGIGAGKSVVGEMLVSAGFYLVDTDIIAREVVAKGSSGLQQVVKLFGEEVLTVGGDLDRRKISERVFGNPEERKKLESILHPLIRKAWMDQVVLETKGLHRGIIVAIPLLYETGAQEFFPHIIGVGCSEEKQRHRLAARGWSSKEIDQRIRAQWSISKKMDKASYVIWNDYSLAICREQVAMVIHLLEKS